jgi:putative SOS response-associated peptidase YedK
MCGRYTLTSSAAEIHEAFGPFELPLDYRARYNIAPTQDVLAVVRAEEGRSRAGWLRWGLVPFWAKDPGTGSRMINARAETAHEKPAFRAAFERRRCLILADGFYEWQKTAGGKVPTWLHLADRRPFALAGLWERWSPPDGGEPLHTCTIVTTQANDFVRRVHDRMPVILPREAAGIWLDAGADQASLRAVLRSYQGDDITAYKVSTLVNSPRNDLPECIVPV